MDKDEIQDKVRKSVDRLLELDEYLLRRDAHEISISHKLAIYLEQQFPDWDVDCEFNKYYGETKDLNKYDKDWVRPDIIIHRRGTNQDLLVIEIKLTTSEEDINSERQKVRLYTEDEELDYDYGLFLHLKADGESGVEEETWF